MNRSIDNPTRITGWTAFYYLGCMLLLLGNTLPWPCPPGYTARDCTALVTYRLSDSWFGNLLVIGLLILPIAVRGFKSPLNYFYWFSFWLFIYLLLIHQLYAVDFGQAQPFYLPLIDINQDLGGPASVLMPLSLIAFWLNTRPSSLQKMWRFAAIVSLIVLILLTVYFWVISALWLNRVNFLPSPYSDGGVFGAAPWVILTGCVILLGALKFERQPAGGAASSEIAPTASKTLDKPAKVTTIGYWSAIFYAAASFSPILYMWVTGQASSGHQTWYEEEPLFHGIFAGFTFLQPLAFLVLMGCLHQVTPSKNKIWSRLALWSAILHAILFLTNTLILPYLRHRYPQLSTSIPFLMPSTGLSLLSFPFLPLAGLFIVPTLSKKGIERTISAGLILNGVLTVAGIIGSILSTSRIPSLYLLILYGARVFVFTVPIALLALVFKRYSSD